ncbi:MAG: ATPase, T2SS/T4P/T4SS family [Oscillospiraceae bacterium]|nr:ATPase, T2SS/T4P/T4SS family [Oscillospiraceae bacterium]
MESYLEILPEWLRDPVRSHPDAEEIRLRAGRFPGVVRNGAELSIGDGERAIRQEELSYVLRAAAKGSLYTAEESLKNGFLTIRGGHRIGLCGTTILRNREINGISAVSSLCIRIAAQRKGIGKRMQRSTLIAGPPGCGKTTYLRDCVRILSADACLRVGLADERGEIAACMDGVPQLDVGERTDVLTGCPKAQAVDLLLRTMDPQWIAVDEITREEDAQALIRGAHCGVRLLATAHCESKNDLYDRPIYQTLIRSGVFYDLILLRPDHSRTHERLCADG